MYFGTENCTGRVADFQKSFKGRWWWLCGTLGWVSLRPLGDALKSLCTPIAGVLCTGVIFPLRPEVVDFRLMQLKPAQVLSKRQSKHCSAFGIATCAESGLAEIHAFSAKLVILDTCSSCATVSRLVLAQNTGDKCSVCVRPRVSIGNLPVYH